MDFRHIKNLEYTKEISEFVLSLKSQCDLKTQLQLADEDLIVDDDSLITKIAGEPCRSSVTDDVFHYLENVRMKCMAQKLTSFATFVALLGAARRTIADGLVWGTARALLSYTREKEEYLPLLCQRIKSLYVYDIEQIKAGLKEANVINPGSPLPRGC